VQKARSIMASLGIKAGKGQIWVIGKNFESSQSQGERVVIEGLVRAEKVPLLFRFPSTRTIKACPKDA